MNDQLVNKNLVLEIFKNDINFLSKQRFSSNVIEKVPLFLIQCFDNSNKETKDIIIKELAKPEIVALSGGKPLDVKQGVNAPGPRQVQMQAKSDESFKTFLPNDARYKITEWNAILVRGKRPVRTKNFSSEVGDFNDFNSQGQPGDRIVIEVKSVKRMNFKGVIEDVNVGTPIINLPLN